jgi:hypothetical protein
MTLSLFQNILKGKSGYRTGVANCKTSFEVMKGKGKAVPLQPWSDPEVRLG